LCRQQRYPNPRKTNSEAPGKSSRAVFAVYAQGLRSGDFTKEMQ
jgi:hypothetical protein